MQRIISNIFRSNTPWMIFLRNMLVGLIVLMGLVRLRILVLYLGFPETYMKRDILEYYLMAKALIAGVSPYLPLNELAQIFIGKITTFTHAAPCTPFIAILSIPLLWFTLSNIVIVGFIFELICLALIASMLTILVSGHMKWAWAIISFFLLLAWYPVMVDLYQGQLSIFLTTLLLAALLAYKRDRRILAGVFIGVSVAVKLITWPLIIYFAMKKDWRTLISSSLTALGLNLIALVAMGIGPFMDYYLRVTRQVLSIYHAVMHNLSVWSIGYRLFEGTGSTYFSNFYKAPPMINLPRLAPWVSILLVVVFLAYGLLGALRSKDIDTAFAIMVCVIVAVSPISWDHYYVMIIISMTVMGRTLAKHSFPARQTVIYVLITLLLLLFNDHITEIILRMNGGIEFLLASGNDFTFISSMLSLLPLAELLLLTILLWRSGVDQRQERLSNNDLRPQEA